MDAGHACGLRIVAGLLVAFLVVSSPRARAQEVTNVTPIPSGRPAGVNADLILYNGEIYTVDTDKPWASAVVIKNGKFVHVGGDRAALRFCGRDTELIDLAGGMALPGLHDSHVHILEAFQAAGGTCYLPPGLALDSYIPIIQACAPDQIGTDWVLGYGHSIYDLHMYMEGGGSSKDILDTALPSTPAAFLEELSHSVWVNSAALALLGFDATTPDPTGGAILRAGNGRTERRPAGSRGRDGSRSRLAAEPRSRAGELRRPACRAGPGKSQRHHLVV